MALAPGHGVDLNGADDAGQGHDKPRGVLVRVLVEGEVLGAQDGPEALPLPDAAVGAQVEEVAVPDDALVILDLEAAGAAGVAGGAGVHGEGGGGGRARAEGREDIPASRFGIGGWQT